MLRLTIPLAPVTKKNSPEIAVNKKTGKPFVLPSKKYREYERQVLDYLAIAMPINFQMYDENRPCEIKELFYMPTHRIVDLTGLEQAIDDILVKAGIIKDDNIRILKSHDGSRGLYDKENPRTEITIREMGEEE